MESSESEYESKYDPNDDEQSEESDEHEQSDVVYCEERSEERNDMMNDEQSDERSEHEQSEHERSSESDSDDLFDDEFLGLIVIGDIHFRSKSMMEHSLFVKKCIEKIKTDRSYISGIVLLGDVLDTHEVAKTQPFNLACKFIDELSSIAKVFVLIGNHDYINNSQVATTNHFFNPLKKWNNVVVVDKPMIYKFHDNITATFCPYVPPGKFIQTLDAALHRDVWTRSNVVFAHQEIKGCNMGNNVGSKSGDTYGPRFPPLVSGHIHLAQQFSNVYYPGSAIQVNFDEPPGKRIWFIDFTPSMNIDYIDVGMKEKKEIIMRIEDINPDTFDTEMCKQFYIKMKCVGTSEQYMMFKRSKFYTTLQSDYDVKITFQLSNDERQSMIKNMRNTCESFTDVVNERVKKNGNKLVMETWDRIMSEEMIM